MKTVRVSLCGIVLLACALGSLGCGGKAASNTGAAPDFSIVATPNSQAVTAGGSANYTIALSPLNGFSAGSTLSVAGLPAGATASFNPPSIGGSSGSSTLTISTSSTTGSFNLSVTGTSGSMIHSAAVILVVNPIGVTDFSLSAAPAAQTVLPGSSANYTVTATPQGGFTGRIALNAANLPMGAIASFNPPSISGAGSSTLTISTSSTAGSFNLSITGTSGSIVHGATVTLAVSPIEVADFSLSAAPATQTVLAGSSASYRVTATPQGGFGGRIALNAANLPMGAIASFNPPSISGAGSSTLTILTSSTTGAFNLSVTGTSGSFVHTAPVMLVVNPVGVADFSLSAAPASQTIPAGRSTSYTVTATEQNGFSGSIALSATNLPLGVVASFNPSSIVGGSGTSVLNLSTASSTPLGPSTITVNGTSGGVSNGTSAVLVVSGTALPVLTYHNDNARTGQSLNESSLTTTNVNQANFGKLFSVTVDGKVDAEPLYVPNLAIPGKGTHNVLFIATEHDSLYAVDADTAGAALWHVSLTKSGETPSDDRGCGQVTPEIGITSTPVIDLGSGSNGTIYVVAMSKNSSGAYLQRLHALDLTTGAEMFGGPTDIHATFPGSGANSMNGNVVFDPAQYKERAGLLLLNGVVYTSWASHCDINPYTAWVMGYDPHTLAQASVLNLTPNGQEGSIWASGAGPAADVRGNIYFLMANGTFDITLDGNGLPNRGDYGNAFVKLNGGAGSLRVSDYFAMFNTVSESNADEDLGSGGALVLPDMSDGNGATRHLVVGAGKDHNIYLLDSDNMGKFNASSNVIYQELAGALGGGEFAMPAYFNGMLYYGAVGDRIKAFKFTNAVLATSPTSQTSNVFGYPGTTPSISANGTANGILWTAENGATAVLHAYDAADLTRELYNSNQAANGRDQFGAGNKFITPLIVNGKVYVGTTNSVGVFGILHP